MNTLSFRTSYENKLNGLSFELLVDGKPISGLIGARDSEIPYWLFDDDLPYFPPFGDDRDMSQRIVTVCVCGEYGCGHTHCRLASSDEMVELFDFDADVSTEGSKKKFLFSRSNYEQVVKEIVHIARNYADKNP